MYTTRLSFSAIFAFIAILMHQYIRGIPNYLDNLAFKCNALLLNNSWYKTTYILTVKLILLIFIPIIVVQIFSKLYKFFRKKKFHFLKARAFLVGLPFSSFIGP